MIIVMKPGAREASVKKIEALIESKGLTAHLSRGAEVTIIGVVGDKTRLAGANIEDYDDVDRIVPVTESYKLVNRKFHPDNTIVTVGHKKADGSSSGVVQIGGDSLVVMSGPCAVETEDQIIETARAIKKSGAHILRGGAYKPRTSPYSFQGLEVDGLKLMQEAGEETGLATICEVTSTEAIEAAVRYVDMLQIGARNMQNFYLLKEAGKTGKPILLKRGMAATIDEWLNAAEYILAEGDSQVVLCERGIRTFETATRNTLDLSAVPVIKEKSHLPIIVDPSHATGVRRYVAPMARAAVAAGADGLMIETHPNPATALSDGPQSLTFAQFDALMKELAPLAAVCGKKLD